MTGGEHGPLDEERIFRALADHGVAFVLVGGSAGTLWGARRETMDVDCVAERSAENHRRLCEALQQMGNPRLRIEGADDAAAAVLSSQLLHPEFFARVEGSTWRTDCGSIDILSSIPGADGHPVGYVELHARATVLSTSGPAVPTASLEDVIASKTHADRQKDRDALPELHELRRRLQERGR